MATVKNLTINDTGYMQLPSGTTAQRPGSPVAGMIRFNTDTSINEYYNGSAWITLVGTQTGVIITSGLILALDASMYSSYPGSGSTWYDTSGNGNHFTAKGTPTWASGAGFSGLNQSNRWYRSAVWPSNLKTSQGGAGYTTMVLAKCTGLNGAWQKLIGNGDDQNYIDIYANNSTGNYHVEDGSTLYYNAGVSVANDSFNMSDGVWRVYYSTNLNSGNTSNPTDNFGIGAEGDDQFNYPWNGNIMGVWIYNRVLSTDEMTTNYNVVKSSVGL